MKQLRRYVVVFALLSMHLLKTNAHTLERANSVENRRLRSGRKETETRRLKKSSKKSSSKSSESSNNNESGCENGASSSKKSKKSSSTECLEKKEDAGEKDTDEDLRADDTVTDSPGQDSDSNTGVEVFRTVRIKPSGDTTQCLSWDSSDTSSPVGVVSCTSAGPMATWEVWPVTQESFKIRHRLSQECIPQNPETPGSAFDCWQSQPGQAVADSINGLIDCNGDFAAVVSFAGPSSSMMVFNTICGTANEESDVVLMSYTAGDSIVALWGEKLLLELDQMMQYNISAEWMFDDIM